MMKVLLLNGSPNERGCTYTALREVADTLEQDGIATEIFWPGDGPVQDCTGCGACRTLHACTFDDDCVNAFVEKAKTADGFIFGTPVYFSHPTGSIQSFLDRAFYSSRAVFEQKPGAAVASARRAGNVTSIDVLNKHFTIAQMPVVSSSYWNVVFGNSPEEVRQDLEGLQIMRNLGHQMACCSNASRPGATRAFLRLCASAAA